TANATARDPLANASATGLVADDAGAVLDTMTVDRRRRIVRRPSLASGPGRVTRLTPPLASDDPCPPPPDPQYVPGSAPCQPISSRARSEPSARICASPTDLEHGTIRAERAVLRPANRSRARHDQSRASRRRAPVRELDLASIGAPLQPGTTYDFRVLAASPGAPPVTAANET